MDACCERFPRPDRIFIGGGLGGGAGKGFGYGTGRGGAAGADESDAGRIFHKAWEALLPGGRLVIHCILLSTLAFVRDRLTRLGASVDVACIQASLSVPLAGDCRLQAQNPVFLVSARKGEGM